MTPPRKLRMNRRGSVAIFAAAGVFSVVGLGGIAVDATRIWMVRSRLKTATDAAALVAARQFDQASRASDARTAFFANFNPDYRAGQPAAAMKTYLGATSTEPVVTQPSTSSVKVSASATVDLTILGTIALKATGSDKVNVSESSTAGRAGSGLELALVMDTTGSMGKSETTNGPAKIETAKAAVGKMLDIIYAGSDTQTNLWVSVVPFARTINIGKPRAGWLDTAGMPAGWNSEKWSGCVEARQGGQDITETSPANAAGKFRPYFWADTYKQHGKYVSTSTSQSSCTDAQSYGADGSGVRWCMGDNDWGNTTLSSMQLLRNPQYISMRDTGAPEDAGASVKYLGPNALCAQSAIQPLAQSKAAVLANVNGLAAAKRSGGTTINVGMQGAWFTLSPLWQQDWNIPTPANGLPVPNAYTTKTIQKMVVLLSDGDNNWQGETDVAPSLKGTEMFYNAYGRLGSGRLTLRSTSNASGSTSDPADSATSIRTDSTSASTNYSSNTARADNGLNYQTRKVCKAMKDAGITIYVVGIEVAEESHRQLLKDCASSPDRHFFESTSLSDLENKFKEIASRIATPRLID